MTTIQPGTSRIHRLTTRLSQWNTGRQEAQREQQEAQWRTHYSARVQELKGSLDELLSLKGARKLSEVFFRDHRGQVTYYDLLKAFIAQEACWRYEDVAGWKPEQQKTLRDETFVTEQTYHLPVVGYRDYIYNYFTRGDKFQQEWLTGQDTQLARQLEVPSEIVQKALNRLRDWGFAPEMRPKQANWDRFYGGWEGRNSLLARHFGVAMAGIIHYEEHPEQVQPWVSFRHELGEMTGVLGSILGQTLRQTLPKLSLGTR